MDIQVTFHHEQSGRIFRDVKTNDFVVFYKHLCEVYDSVVDDPEFSLDLFCEAMLQVADNIIDNIAEKSNDNTNSYRYVEIFIGNNYFTFYGYKNNIITVIEKHINEKSLKSNTCIDKFVDKCILPNIYSMVSFAYDIKGRSYEREKRMKEYHQSACYEQDVSEIISIKNKARKIVDLCNKKLEVLFENYTK